MSRLGDLGAGGSQDVWVATTLAAPDDPGVRQFEPTDVTPGVLGFAVTFAVVIGLVVLLLSMVGKLRRVNHRPPDVDEAGATDLREAPGTGGTHGAAGPRPDRQVDGGAEPADDGRV